MDPLTLTEIYEALRLDLPGDAPRTLRIESVCTDTRAMKPRSLFIAIRGERFNAHDFLPQAAASGAAAAIVETSFSKKLPGLYLIPVDNTRAALGAVARFVRSRFTGKVIGVAGSNGKTSTKYLIDSVLSGRLGGSMSPKSFNNDVGVPLTILPADPRDDYLVLELGTNHPGEIATLAEIANPDIAVITNCGAEHLEFLGDLDGVRKENASLVLRENLPRLLIVNGDDEKLLSAVESYRGKRLTFGFRKSNDIFANDVRCEIDGTRFQLNNKKEVFLPMLGRHSASNALAAIAVGWEMGLEDAAIIESLASARGPDMRLQIQEVPGRIRILNDAYNANPNSMRAAIETLAAMPAASRRIAVLGDMKELGISSEKYHREIGELAARSEIDLLACVGPLAAYIGEAAVRGGMKKASVKLYENSEAAANEVSESIDQGDLVLLKGSRSMRLERVARAIVELHV